LAFQIKTDNPDSKLQMIKEVLQIVSQFNDANWPSDKTWDTKLPIWFLAKIKYHEYKEIINNPMLWDYRSWRRRPLICVNSKSRVFL
jgi:hypothetical protein